jgi:hypothetical protein
MEPKEMIDSVVAGSDASDVVKEVSKKVESSI